MKQHVCRLALALLPLALAACGEPAGVEAAKVAVAGIPRSQPVTIEALKQHTKGFEVGAPMSARRVYVFFDPQCPHCARLWQDSKQLHDQVRFTWIPVSIMRPVGMQQGATLLHATDPVGAMNLHEAALTAGRGGIAGASNDPAELAEIQRNTAVFESFGATSVPFVVGEHARTGARVTIPGALPAAALAQQLGLNPQVR